MKRAAILALAGAVTAACSSTPAKPAQADPIYKPVYSYTSTPSATPVAPVVDPIHPVDEYVTYVGGRAPDTLPDPQWIVEGQLSVQFEKKSNGDILRLASGRPVIKDEDIMLDMARNNMLENYGKFVGGGIFRGVGDKVVHFLRNYANEPQVKSFQENISQLAFKATLPAIREYAQVIRGNQLIIRGDTRKGVSQYMEQQAMKTLDASIEKGVLDRDQAMEFLRKTLREAGLE